MASESRKEVGLHLVLSRQDGKSYEYSFSRISLLHDEEKGEYWSEPRYDVMRSFCPKTRTPYLVGCCNGLMCLLFDDDEYTRGSSINSLFTVWEPSTDKFQVIPKPDSLKSCDSYGYGYGCGCGLEFCFTESSSCFAYLFYFDSQSQDYKVVSFTQNCYVYRYPNVDIDDSVLDWLPHKESSYVEVYSFKNNTWKNVPLPDQFDHLYFPDGFGTFVDGVCYWHSNGDVMFAFNVVTEEFFNIPYPDLDCIDYYFDMMTELDGSLCLVFYRKQDWRDAHKYYQKEGKGEKIEEGIMSFWVYSLSSSSWSRRTDFDLRIEEDGFHHPVWFGKKNDRNGGYSLLLLREPSDYDAGAFVEYDYATRKFNTIYQKVPHFDDDLAVYPYVETKTKNNANIWHMSSSSSS